MMEDVPEPHDAHVRQATKLFRDHGFTLAAMEFPRCAEAVEAIRLYNRAPNNWQHPFAWNFHPNEWHRDNWQGLYARAEELKQ